MRRLVLLTTLLFATGLTVAQPSAAQPSVARHWNEVLLEAIRNDFARPTVHARNLFHISAAMYDAWAAYDDHSSPYFLGRSPGGHTISFTGIEQPADVPSARQEAISFACYRLIRFRFRNSPGWAETFMNIEQLMDSLGYNPAFTDEDYTTGRAAALGNYLAARIIEYGLQDNANEGGDYQSLSYLPTNNPLLLTQVGNQDITDPNRWQPLAFNTFVDQSGHEVPGGVPPFLGAEWGRVTPFALSDEDRSIYERESSEFWVYHDPGDPCYLDPRSRDLSADYKWNFSLVAQWSSHLDPADGVLWDISPGRIGNLPIETFPTTITGLRDFYNTQDGGDPGTGYAVNPKTNRPYEPQIVARGDYTRVLAEFWADGPDSETPPGHWYTILNYVNDHPQLEKRYRGEGEVLDPLEWDVKSYFILGGAMHDAAITAWSIKGYYDFIRPISAIRYMADRGQSSAGSRPSYHVEGLPLAEGYSELVAADDPLAGPDGEHVGKVKLYAWRGHNYIQDTTDVAGVGWILAEEWWPYQRPNFVTPPFAGYVSGHSTFSRAAATVLTMLTGNEYFPGGMGEFVAKKNEFLAFEEGPSTDVVLQWATYADASDQCSLSRIWGGIHPPVDDIPGRLIGEEVGKDAFRHARKYIEDQVLAVDDGERTGPLLIYPNPVRAGQPLRIRVPADQPLTIRLLSVQGAVVHQQHTITRQKEARIDIPQLPAGAYLISLEGRSAFLTQGLLIE